MFAKSLGVSLATLSGFLSIVAMIAGTVVATVAWARTNDLDHVEEKMQEAAKARAGAFLLEENARTNGSGRTTH